VVRGLSKRGVSNRGVAKRGVFKKDSSKEKVIQNGIQCFKQEALQVSDVAMEEL
jgi:hypothetical protein